MSQVQSSGDTALNKMRNQALEELETFGGSGAGMQLFRKKCFERGKSRC